MSSLKWTFTLTGGEKARWVPLAVIVSNVCDREDRRAEPGRDDSLDPNGVIGEELCGDSSDEPPPVDWLDPLPRLLLEVAESCDRGGHITLGTGGGRG